MSEKFSKEEWKRLWKHLVRAYPKTFAGYDQSAIDESGAVYYIYLQDIDFALVKVAIARHISSSDWMPRISEIRNMAYETAKNHAGIPSAEEAWGEVLALVQRVGPATSVERLPQFSHPFVKQTVGRFGGWNLLCESRNQVADRAHFVRLYRQISDAHKESVVASIPEEVERRIIGSGSTSRIDGERPALKEAN